MVKYEVIKEQETTTNDRLVAASKLGGSAFKIYCYLESSECYSQPFVIKFFKLDHKTVSKAFNELIEKGYVQRLSSTQIQFNGK